MRTIALALLLIVVALAASGYAALRYFTAVPGKSHAGALPPLTGEERAIAARLERHIAIIAAREHNIAHYDELEKVALHLEATLRSLGYEPGRQEFNADDKTVRNIDAVIEASGTTDPDVVVVGAHYDSAEGTLGANDNASGTAVLLELAQLLKDLQGQTRKRIRLVFFVNEEPPYFQTEDMGSLRYAKALAAREERVTAMYSLETLGFYSSEPGSQQYPPPLGLLYPDRGDFVSFVGLTNSRPLVRQTVESFRAHTPFPSVGGVAPGVIPGIDWSDHWAFAVHGFQAVMVTDTAIFRYPHYHKPTDTPDKVDVERLARITKGMERVVRDLVR